jgi:NADPH-dependent 2,4-dienoyl-CoA reductase/sulfur reductase-like enzyme
MADHSSEYLIVGAGLAGTSAALGIRECDTKSTITIIGAEAQIPYDRPPLSKKLWFGKKEVKDIFLQDRAFYDQNNISLFLGRRVVTLDPKSKTVTDDKRETHSYQKLLLATGGTPQILQVPGGDLAGIYYYRTLDDYERLRAEAVPGASAVIIGGGFIGSEMAAALCINKLKVTMIYPSTHLCDRVFPEDLGAAMEQVFRDRGVRILKGRKPVSFGRKGSRFIVTLSDGEKIESDLVIAGIGIKPAVGPAEQALLTTGDGIIVNEYLQTSHPDVFAAGDNVRLSNPSTGQQAHMEHWDNARSQGRHAGRNMACAVAGRLEPFTYLPYFFSDLFEFGYEAVGEVDSRMDTITDWKKPFNTGVIYYLKDGRIRGAMMCNVWEKVEEIRDMIRRGAQANERLK